MKQNCRHCLKFLMTTGVEVLEKISPDHLCFRNHQSWPSLVQFWLSAVHYLETSEQHCFSADFSETELNSTDFFGRRLTFFSYIFVIFSSTSISRQRILILSSHCEKKKWTIQNSKSIFKENQHWTSLNSSDSEKAKADQLWWSLGLQLGDRYYTMSSIK